VSPQSLGASLRSAAAEFRECIQTAIPQILIFLTGANYNVRAAGAIALGKLAEQGDIYLPGLRLLCNSSRVLQLSSKHPSWPVSLRSRTASRTITGLSAGRVQPRWSSSRRRVPYLFAESVFALKARQPSFGKPLGRSFAGWVHRPWLTYGNKVGYFRHRDRDVADEE
jgi:hypothetical protein